MFQSEPQFLPNITKECVDDEYVLLDICV